MKNENQEIKFFLRREQGQGKAFLSADCTTFQDHLLFLGFDPYFLGYKLHYWVFIDKCIQAVPYTF
jgi:hypothetical protein